MGTVLRFWSRVVAAGLAGVGVWLHLQDPTIGVAAFWALIALMPNET